MAGRDCPVWDEVFLISSFGALLNELELPDSFLRLAKQQSGVTPSSPAAAVGGQGLLSELDREAPRKSHKVYWGSFTGTEEPVYEAYF